MQTDITHKELNSRFSNPDVHLGLIQNEPKNHGYVSLAVDLATPLGSFPSIRDPFPANDPKAGGLYRRHALGETSIET